jgi:streptogramin lyase
MNTNTRLKCTILRTGRLLALAAMICILGVGSANAVPQYCLQFNGANYVDLGNGTSLHFQNEITLEAWIWAPPIPNDAMWPIVSSQFDPAFNGASLTVDGRQNPDGMTAQRRHINFQLGDGAWHPTNSDALVPENQWVHIAATRQMGGPGNIYYNGVLQPSTSTPWDGWLGFSANWNIGRQLNTLRFFQGKTDEVRIWSRALSQDEIRDVMCRRLTGAEPGLAGYWRLDEGTGLTTVDTTANGNTGTLNGGPVWLSSDLFTSIQPDLQIKNVNETNYIGGGTYNDSPTKRQSVAQGISAIYDVKLVNKRVACDRFLLAGSPGGSGWEVKYFDESAGGTDITTQVTAGTWKSGVIPPGESIRLRIEVKPDLSVAPGLSQEITLVASSTSDLTKTDSVKTVTTVSSVLPAVVGKLYTLDADFNLGVATGLEHQTVHNQLQLDGSFTTLPTIWIPNSNQGTVSKLDTVTGKELARYRVSPSTNSQPSRTTVDQMGNCWVANRQTGTVVKIGLLENGEWIDRNSNGVCDTSRDLDGDGIISDSEMLAWGADECVEYEVVVVPNYEGTFTPGAYTGVYADDYWNPGPRGIAVDGDNNVWIGTYGTQKYYKVDGDTASILEVIDVSSADHTPYGAVIDRNGILWSTSYTKNHLLRLDTRNGQFSVIPVGHCAYGLGIDWTNHLFVSGFMNSVLSRFNISTAGKDWTNATSQCKGLAVTSDGNVWIGDIVNYRVSRLTNDGALLATIPIGMFPTGMSVDAAGKVWVLGQYDERLMRIDPATNTIDLTKPLPGTEHYGYSDMTGIISMNTTCKVGTWTVIHDSGATNTIWGLLMWNGTTPMGTSISVQARSSANCRVWSAWKDAVNGEPLIGVPQRRFLQVRVTLRKAVGPTSPVLSDLAIIPMPSIASVVGAKAASDIDTVFLQDADVSGLFGSFFYIENDDRSTGIRVYKPANGLLDGQSADVFGIVKTNASDERYIEASVVLPHGTCSVRPIGMVNRDVGGEDWLDPVTLTLGQKGVLGGTGVNNIGLLVTVWGTVTQFDSATPKTWFRISDGSEFDAKCIVPSGVSIDSGWNHVLVTGISSCEKVDGEVHRLVRVRTQSDIKSY